MTPNKIISIAIAEDHPIFRKGLILGINVYDDCAVDIIAENGLDLLEKIAAANKLPDICILDISMPVMDGYEALTKIKSRWPGIKVIMLSLHNNEFTIIKSYRSGANSYLPKEVDFKELHTAILKVYNGDIYYSDLTSLHITNMLHNQSINTDLTDKEIIFLRLVCTDMTYKEIAIAMNLSMRTIDGYRDRLFDKLKVTSRVGLAMVAINSGIK